MRLVSLEPRIVFLPAGSGSSFTPWVEATLVVRLKLSDWGTDEIAFLHWAARWREGETSYEWRHFEPGRLAAMVGVPDGWKGPEKLDQPQREALFAAVQPLCPRDLFCHRGLGLLGKLGESFSSFRHRCLRAFAPVVQEGLLRRELQAAQEVARVLGGIERHVLSEEELEVLEARFGLAFYPQGLEPGPAKENLMVEG